MYQGTKTWANGPWTYRDANRYITDNLNSVRRYQSAVNGFEGLASVTTTATPAGAQAALCPTPPDEPTRLHVFLSMMAYADNVPSPAAHLSITLRDQDGTSLNYEFDSYLFDGPVMMAVDTLHRYPCIYNAYTYVQAGTNPGFDLLMSCDSSTVTAHWGIVALVTPIA